MGFPGTIKETFSRRRSTPAVADSSTTPGIPRRDAQHVWANRNHDLGPDIPDHPRLGDHPDWNAHRDHSGLRAGFWASAGGRGRGWRSVYRRRWRGGRVLAETGFD